MANKIGKAKIEFYRKGEDTPAVTGTDCVIEVDGRWSMARAFGEIEYAANAYIAKHPSLEWRQTIHKFSHSREAVINSHGIFYKALAK
jgi:hypothetical protein